VNGTEEEEEPRRRMEDDFVVGRDRQRLSAAAVRNSCTHCPRPFLLPLLDEDHHIDRRSNGTAAEMIASWYVFLSLSFLTEQGVEHQKGINQERKRPRFARAAAAFGRVCFLQPKNRVPKSVAFVTAVSLVTVVRDRTTPNYVDWFRIFGDDNARKGDMKIDPYDR
jgi:hypothetical protein